MLNKTLIASAYALSLALTACGGGEKSLNENVSSYTQPFQLKAKNLEYISSFHPTTRPSLTVDNDDNDLYVNISNLELNSLDNTQVFINIDNSDKTGHKFSAGFWDDTGADYLLENHYLFKSTANDTSWGWELISELPENAYNGSTLSVKIPMKYLEKITPIIRVGFIKANSEWSVESFTPAGSQMVAYELEGITVPPNSDKTKPIISIVGSQSIKLLLGDNNSFTSVLALGATAEDNIDGDITSKITTDSSKVDIHKLGTYPLRYRVTDNAGNTSEHARNIEVVNSLAGSALITIDGDLADWSGIPSIAEENGSSIKMTSDDDKVYLGITIPAALQHPQVFLDVDSNHSTGFPLSYWQWQGTGADFLIENGYFNKYKGNGKTWSWEYDWVTIDYVHKTNGNELNTIEIAIDRSALTGLGDNIKVSFANADESWNRALSIPSNEIASYTPEPISEDNLASADRNDISLFGDPMFERIVGMQLSTMKQIVDLPIHGSTVYSSDIYDATKSYAYSRGSSHITVLNRNADTGNFEEGKQINLPFAARTGAKNRVHKLELITGSLKPMWGLIDATTDELIAFGGRNVSTYMDDSNHGSHWATGHGNWLTDTHFVVPDRQQRKLTLYKFDPVTRDVTELNSIFTDSSVHAAIGKLNNTDGLYYASTEGSNESNPSVIKFTMKNDTLTLIDQVHLIGSDPTVMGGHHVGATPNGEFLYMGSSEGNLNVIELASFSVVKVIPTGKGAGHRTLIPSRNLALITNHNDTFITVIDISTNTKIKDIPVSGLQRNNQALQAHTARVSPDAKYYYNFATDNGFMYRVDLERLVMDKVYYTGGTPKQASQPGEVK